MSEQPFHERIFLPVVVLWAGNPSPLPARPGDEGKRTYRAGTVVQDILPQLGIGSQDWYQGIFPVDDERLPGAQGGYEAG